MAKKPAAYRPMELTTDAPYRKDYATQTLDQLKGWATGGQPLMSQGQINQQLSGSRGRLNADMAAERMRIAERAMDRQGAMGGMAEASMAALGRAGLGQSRQLEAGVQNALAQQAPGFRLDAARAGLGYIGQDQQLALDEYHRQQAQEAQRQQFSKWGNILGGAVSGMGMMGGMGGMFGGGKAQTYNTQSGVDYPYQPTVYTGRTYSGSGQGW